MPFRLQIPPCRFPKEKDILLYNSSAVINVRKCNTVTTLKKNSVHIPLCAALRGLWSTGCFPPLEVAVYTLMVLLFCLVSFIWASSSPFLCPLWQWYFWRILIFFYYYYFKRLILAFVEFFSFFFKCVLLLRLLLSGVFSPSLRYPGAVSQRELLIMQLGQSVVKFFHCKADIFL